MLQGPFLFDSQALLENNSSGNFESKHFLNDPIRVTLLVCQVDILLNMGVIVIVQDIFTTVQGEWIHKIFFTMIIPNIPFRNYLTIGPRNRPNLT